MLRTLEQNSAGRALEERWRSTGGVLESSGGGLEEVWRSCGAVEASLILTNYSHSGAPKPDFDECFALWSKTVLEELWRSAGGALESFGGCLEELWRSSGGGLEELWRSAGGALELWRKARF